MGFIGAAVCGKLVAQSTHTPLLYGGSDHVAQSDSARPPLSAAGCQTIPHAPPRYIVSSEPMLFLGAANPSFCVAVDPARANGVWLWHPGRSGCASRTSSLMDATMIAGTVARLASGAVEASFQISLMTGGPRHVRLELRDGRMREPSTGLNVATERRAELDMPEIEGPTARSGRTLEKSRPKANGSTLVFVTTVVHKDFDRAVARAAP